MMTVPAWFPFHFNRLRSRLCYPNLPRTVSSRCGGRFVSAVATLRKASDARRVRLQHPVVQRNLHVAIPDAQAHPQVAGVHRVRAEYLSTNAGEHPLHDSHPVARLEVGWRWLGRTRGTHGTVADRKWGGRMPPHSDRPGGREQARGMVSDLRAYGRSLTDQVALVKP